MSWNSKSFSFVAASQVIHCIWHYFWLETVQHTDCLSQILKRLWAETYMNRLWWGKGKRGFQITQGWPQMLQAACMWQTRERLATQLQMGQGLPIKQSVQGNRLSRGRGPEWYSGPCRTAIVACLPKKTGPHWANLPCACTYPTKNCMQAADIII